MNKWETEGRNIRPDDIDSLLYENDSVKEFLNIEGGKYFIVAEKGMGKSLLLSKKRYELENKKCKLEKDSSILIIPKNNPYLDTFGNDYNEKNLDDRAIIGVLKDRSFVKQIWAYAIRLSAIKNFNNIHREPTIKYDDLSDFSKNILHRDMLAAPCSILEYLLSKDISKVRNGITRDSVELTSLFNSIHSGVYFFIDRLDQNFEECPREVWINIQVGLIEAVWDLNQTNNHVKVFCSIRKGAFSEYKGVNKAALSGSVCHLKYGNDDLHKLVNKLSECYEGKTLEQIIGFDKFIHPKTNKEETVFDYLLRHTLSRPRDLVWLISSLPNKEGGARNEKEKISKLRESVNEQAMEIARQIFAEKVIFLDSIKEESIRDKFLSSIPKNVLGKETLKQLCKKFNGKNDSECYGQDCPNRNTSGCSHPFCELYNIGLLGYVDNTDVPCKQIFKDPYNNKEINHIPSSYDFYVMHPCLNRHVRALKNKENAEQYIVTEGITVGNGCDWGERETQISNLIDNALKEQNKEKRESLLKNIRDAIREQKNINIDGKDYDFAPQGKIFGPGGVR